MSEQNAERYAVLVGGIVAAGMEDYMQRFLTRLMRASRAHDGCLAYNVHQSCDDAREFMMYSLWRDRQAFAAHNETPIMQEFKKHLAKEVFTVQSPKTDWRPLPETEAKT